MVGGEEKRRLHFQNARVHRPDNRISDKMASLSFSSHDNSFPTDLNAATFYERLDCLKPGAIDQKNNIQLQCSKDAAAMFLELFCSLGGEGSNIYIFFC